MVVATECDFISVKYGTKWFYHHFGVSVIGSIIALWHKSTVTNTDSLHSEANTTETSTLNSICVGNTPLMHTVRYNRIKEWAKEREREREGEENKVDI